jgi:DNA-binding ferritin-like protein
MENINKLICCLMAIQYFAKDIHYSCKGEAFYGKHLLADRIYDGLDDFIDGIKETCLLGNDILPLHSGEYLIRATSLIPAIEYNDKKDFESMQKLLVDCLVLMQEMLQEKDTPRAEVSLVDGIAQNLQQKLGLVNLQVKD